MDFVEYINAWARSEVLQGKVMIGIGMLMAVGYFVILKSDHEFLRGSLIPLGLLLMVLLGYGSYILFSRPAHAARSVQLYSESKQEAISNEVAKHTNDNRAGKPLTRVVYPILILASVIAAFFISNAYYRGMAIGFLLLFISALIIDRGFVSRSDAFLSFLETLS